MSRTEEIRPSVGEIRHERCPTCDNDTLQTGTIYAITRQGAMVIGGYAVCETCQWTPYGTSS